MTAYSINGMFDCVAWVVEFTGEFEQWWNTLGQAEQEEISAKVELLQQHGPVLPRPHADVIATSKHANMKELRGRAGAANLRVLFAFDPRRTAILLIGGDKTGNPDWYDEYVPIADRLFTEHVEALEREEQEKEKSRGAKEF